MDNDSLMVLDYNCGLAYGDEAFVPSSSLASFDLDSPLSHSHGEQGSMDAQDAEMQWYFFQASDQGSVSHLAEEERVYEDVENVANSPGSTYPSVPRECIIDEAQDLGNIADELSFASGLFIWSREPTPPELGIQSFQPTNDCFDEGALAVSPPPEYEEIENIANAPVPSNSTVGSPRSTSEVSNTNSRTVNPQAKRGRPRKSDNKSDAAVPAARSPLTIEPVYRSDRDNKHIIILTAKTLGLADDVPLYNAMKVLPSAMFIPHFHSYAI
ncbi:hypothetical protein M413DRAFT_27329 [Hebeloma cylindrosporum]|uniref:Uncharacterized protein n=1 Tax=Hebeloma cylindrosporum TaxID=76867 RepID=A0A0C2XVS3_HEBCY|nr:hypothetical protein M413DRAFT_27329 [Hebeloma cylindrosporum h7]